MKKVLIFLAAVLVAEATFGQGQLAFDTYEVGFKASTWWDAPFGDLPEAAAQLWLVNGNGYTLTPLLPICPFNSAPSPYEARYYINPPEQALIVPGVGPGQQATFRLRVWDGSPNYETATIRGESSDFTITLGGGNHRPTEFGSFGWKNVGLDSRAFGSPY